MQVGLEVGESGEFNITVGMDWLNTWRAILNFFAN